MLINSSEWVRFKIHGAFLTTASSRAIVDVVPGYLQMFLAQHQEEEHEQAEQKDAEDGQCTDSSDTGVHLFGCNETK